MFARSSMIVRVRVPSLLPRTSFVPSRFYSKETPPPTKKTTGFKSDKGGDKTTVPPPTTNTPPPSATTAKASTTTTTTTTTTTQKPTTTISLLSQTPEYGFFQELHDGRREEGNPDWKGLTSSEFNQFKQPLRLYSPSGEYAKTLWALGQAAKTPKTVGSDVINIRQVYKGQTELREFLNNPTIKSEQKLQLLKKIFVELKVSDTTQLFFKVLASHNSFEILGEVLDDYVDILKTAFRVLDVTVTSAYPLTGVDFQFLQHKFVDKHFKDVHPNFISKVDASMGGGFKIRLGDYYYDYSFEAQLKQRKQVMEVSVNKYLQTIKPPVLL